MKRAWRIVFVEREARMGGVEFSTLNLVTRLNRNRFALLVVCPAQTTTTKAYTVSSNDASDGNTAWEICCQEIFRQWYQWRHRREAVR